MILRRFAANAAQRLLPMLRTAGTNALMRIVEQRAPAASEVVRAVAGALGLPVDRATDDEVTNRVVEEYARDPEGVVAAMQVVEADDTARWQAEADKAEEYAALLATEYESKSVLVRLWRPIFSLMAAVTIPSMIVMLFVLVWRGTDAALVQSFVTATLVAIPALAGPVGAYIWGRTREKVAGVER